MLEKIAPRYSAMMEAMDINGAIKAIWQLISRANKYIDETEPWILAKDPAKAARLNTVLYHLLEVLAAVSVLVEPYMPVTAKRMRKPARTAGRNTCRCTGSHGGSGNRQYQARTSHRKARNRYFPGLKKRMRRL